MKRIRANNGLPEEKVPPSPHLRLLLNRTLECGGQRQGKHFDSFVSQRGCLVRTGGAANRTLFGLTVMDFSRFFSKPCAYVFSAFNDPSSHLHPHRLDLVAGHLRWMRRRLRGRTLSLAMRQIQARCREHFAKRTATAKRALHKRLGNLPFVFSFRSKPAFETVVGLTTKIKDFHEVDCKGFVR